MVENLCHAADCEQPSCCTNNELEIYRHEIKYFTEAIPVQSLKKAREIIDQKPGEKFTFIIEQQTIMDNPSQYLIVNSKECVNLTEDGNCKVHGKITACGPNTPIGGHICTKSRLRDGKRAITPTFPLIPLEEIG